MDDTKLSKREEAYLDALIEGLVNLVSKLSTTTNTNTRAEED